MALPDLTGQNIQDTYQRVLQTDNGTLRDGTGSLITLTNITASGNISASGDIFANEIILKGSSAGIQIESDSATEIQSTGTDNFNIVAGGHIHLLADGASKQLRFGSDGTNSQLVLNKGHVTASGNISASGDINATTGSFGRVICTTISASAGDFDANTIRIGGTSFNKSDLDTLKEGKSIRTDAKDLKGSDGTSNDIIVTRGIFSHNDDDTFIKFGTNIMSHVVSGSTFFEIQKTNSNNKVTIGNGTTDIQLKGNINEATLDGGTF